MLWRVRANLPDRPGALGQLAHECGKSGVNIVRVQVFPGRAAVTDELVVDAPEGFGISDLIGLTQRAGGESVVAMMCNEAALDDQPTRFVKAALAVLDAPATFPDVVAHLFDADVAPTSGHEDVLEMTVGNATVQIRRDTPFTSTERTRGEAMAELVTHVLNREQPPAPGSAPEDAELEYVATTDAVSALVGGRVTGRASYSTAAEGDPWPVDMWVDPAWQRRGIGTRLLADIARMARSGGADEIVLTAPADSQAVLPMVLSAGLRGRIRMAGETVTVRVAVSDLRI